MRDSGVPLLWFSNWARRRPAARSSARRLAVAASSRRLLAHARPIGRRAANCRRPRGRGRRQFFSGPRTGLRSCKFLVYRSLGGFSATRARVKGIDSFHRTHRPDHVLHRHRLALLARGTDGRMNIVSEVRRTPRARARARARLPSCCRELRI